MCTNFSWKHFDELLGMGKHQHIYLGLYDGHLGKEAAEYATTHVHVQIGKALRVTNYYYYLFLSTLAYIVLCLLTLFY